MNKSLVASCVLSLSCTLATTAAAVDGSDWQNPGGMWMPQQILEQGPLLRRLGLQIDPTHLSDPSSSTLQAVISLGFCSGSFVSPEGLIITNHHCVQGMLSYLSKEDEETDHPHDYVKTGFHARSLGEERAVSPTQRVYVTEALSDVTSTVLSGMSEVADEEERGRLIEERIKLMVAEAEAGATNIRAEVASFFRGAQFVLIKKLELKDVRLVYAPPSAVGFYGGDSDNWMWPRHTGDFAFLRAYVGADGSSQPYSKDNRPYRPANHLTVNRSGVEAGNLIFVAGYPGSTNRLDTASEVTNDVETFLPYTIKKLAGLRQLLADLGAGDESLRIKLESSIFSLDNGLKNRRESLKALTEVNYLGEKRRFEDELGEWLASHPDYSGLADTLEQMEALRSEFHAGWERRDRIADLMGGLSSRFIHLINAAVVLVRMAEERPKADEARHPDYQQRNWQRLMQAEDDAQSKYDRRISQQVFRWAIDRALLLPDQDLPEVFHSMFDVAKARQNPKLIDVFLEHLYSHTRLEDAALRKKLLTEASLEELLTSSDPVIQLAIPLALAQKEREVRSRRIVGASLDVVPGYIAALRAFLASKGRLLAPDANSTLRLTFGHVKGYHRPVTGEYQYPFTSVVSLAARHRPGDAEYEVPAEIMQAIAEGRFGPYTDANFGLVPVNFLAAVDTTGGNSGSAALDASGRLIGLLFDGNSDALYSDWVFKDENVRSILLDIRYALWILDKVEHADHLLTELGIR